MDTPAPQEWYVLTGNGTSALRISAGLTVGESSTGALTLNDPEMGHQWIELVINDSGDPWVAIITRDKSLRVDGASHMRYRLTEGTALQLPNNTLYISRDIRMPRPSGVVIEVVPRDVPGRAQDLMGPEWAEAIAAIREPSAGASLEDELEPEDAEPFGDSVETAEEPEPEFEPEAVGSAEPRDPFDDLERTRVYEPPPRRAPRRTAEAPTEFDPRPSDGRRAAITEPRRGGGYRRRPRRRGRAAALLATLAVVGVAIGGVAAVVFTLYGPLWPAGDSDRLPGFVDAPLDRVPDGPNVGRTADAASWQEPVGQVPVGQPSVGQDPLGQDPLGQEPVGPEPDAVAAGGNPAAAAVRETGVPTDAAPDSAAPDPLVSAAPGGDPAAPDSAGDLRPAQAQVPADSQARAGSAETPSPQAASAEPAPAAPSPSDAGAPAEAQVALLPRREPAGDDRTESQPAPEPTVSATGPSDWRLVRARELLDAGYITFPPRDNAVDYVQRLLADDPGNRQALAMLELCSDRLIDAALRAHDQGMDYEARNTLEEVFGFDPQNERANRLWREWVGPR
ncbi:MAG TPA: hypothetical protein VF210_20180 [Pseudomonadales bacterium]